MKHCDSHRPQKHDKQLQGVLLEAVMEKRRLDQAMNAKEFAICAGVSYSTARHWFHLPGFPVFHRVVFWNDFVQWRTEHYGLSHSDDPQPENNLTIAGSGLPPQAARILLDS